MSCDNPIGVFDSGVGGLSVLSECVSLMPHERFIYIADRAHMPYGRLSATEIRNAAINCAEFLVAMNCKAIAVACNTATENAISELRRLYRTVTVVGLEPAVKPCCAELNGGYAVALVTPATARSKGFMRLMSVFGEHIVVAAQPDLASVIERNMTERSDVSQYIRRILEPYKDAEAVILGCSHYALIKKTISEFYGGKIKIYDGAKGEAERLKFLLEQNGLLCGNGEKGSIRFFST